MLVQLDRRRDGTLEDIFYNFIYQPITDAAGQVEGIFVHAVDVTSQVRARQTLEIEVAARRRAQGLLAGERAILEMIARGRPLEDTLAALAHLIEQEAAGVLCSILLLQRDDPFSREGILRHGAAPSLPEEYNRAIDGIAIGPAVGSCGTAAYRGEPVVVLDIAGDPLWADFRDLALSHGLRACWSTPIRDSDGRVQGTFALYYREPSEPGPKERELVAVLTYLAGIAIERHRNEAERNKILAREREARAAAEAAVKVRDEFLSIASHELRTPVTVVKGVTQLLQRGVRRNRLDLERLPHHIDTIQRASDRLSVLISDLLDVSRLQSGQLTLRLELLDLVGLVQDVVDRHAMQLTEGHVLRARLPDAVVMVEADATRLEQILDNLLGNAAKYSPAGSPIDVRLSVEEDSVTVMVQDTGIGLPDSAAERIFEPFGRAENAIARNVPGMGLGLYVSRRIAELHAGRLWAESAGEGQGTTLYLWLPRVSEPQEH
jgi:signal transduction histidine kinase